ncbi:DUF4331 family protein [Mycobacterium sp. HNNTM2301]|uniref:DUF4331 family protein n=1 Tax=Mycobacterium hainanense TaxID=3289775 RepID=UPI0035A66D76
MSHHFDIPSGRHDPRLNLCDFYLFAGGAAGTSAMVMTVNPAANAHTAAPFRHEAIYAFRFDTDGDQGEDVSFKVHFGDVVHTPSRSTDLGHAQTFEVRRADHACDGLDGDVVARGQTNAVVCGEDGVRAFAGIVHDPFAGDASALEAFKAAFAQGSYKPEAFGNRVNFFADRTIAAIVLEVPNHLISNTTRVCAWTTVSLYGHAPEQQVARWGLPLLTHIYLGGDALRERFNRSRPSDDNSVFFSSIVSTVSKYAAAAGTAHDPQAYGRRVARLFGSLTLPYELGTVASFDYAGFNGRSLCDNVMDNMLSLLTNSPLGTGIGPNPAAVSDRFPYLLPATGR